MAKRSMVKFSTAMLFGSAFILLLLAIQMIGDVPACAGVSKEAKQAFDGGDFYRCINILSVELRKKPDHQDNIALMEQTIPLFFDKTKRNAEKAETRQLWDEAFSEYKQLVDIGDVLSEIPPVPKKVQGQKEKVATPFQLPGDLFSKLEEVRGKAIEYHYNKAQTYEKDGSFKDAAIEYRLTREFDPDFKDTPIRYEECRDKATLKIAVMPFEDGTGSSYGALGDLLTQQVIAEAMAQNPEFLKFITRDYLDQMLADQGEVSGGTFTSANATKFGKQLGVHAFVFGKLMSIIENYPPLSAVTGQNDYQTTRNKQTVILRCEYTINKREGSAKVLGSFQIIDGATGVIKTSSNIEAMTSDFTSWVTFRGDEEAIPYEVKQQNLENRSLLPPAELTTRAINDLGTDVAKKLVDTFR